MRRSTLALPALAFVLAAPVQAQDSLRILDPQSLSGAGAGWSVDPATGRLGLVLPFAAVPGEIPLALPFAFKASHEVDSRYVSDPNWEACLTCGPAPKVTVSNDRPIYAQVHFGYITTPAYYGGYTENTSYVLEDGTQFRARDFVANTNGPALQAPSLFGLASKSWSQVRTHVSGRLIAYDATLADLGTWSYRAQSLVPTGFALGAGYKILMDKDRARIHVFLNELQAWVPILWVDRFNHFVGFQWKRASAAGMNVTSVKALNQRNLGLQVQWAEPAVYGADVEQVLLRADYIGVQAPSVQVTGFSGLSDFQPTALGGAYSNPILAPAAGPVLRPTQLRAGNPNNLPAPAWMSAGLPQPSPAGWDPWGNDLQWTFAYDAAHAELASFTDPRGATTAFTYGNATVFDGAPRNSNQIRGVLTANTGSLQRTWTRTLPTYASRTWTSTSWVASLTQRDLSGASTDVPTQEWTFADPSQAIAYGNGAPLCERLYSPSKTWSTFNHTPGNFGLDGSLTKDIAPGLSQDGRPNTQASTTIDGVTGLPSYESVTVGGTTVQTTSYQYEARPDLLEPGRPTFILTSRLADGSLAALPTQGIQYDPTSGLPTRVWSFFGSTQRGQSFTYDSEGHLQSVASYPSGTPSLSTTYQIGPNGLPSGATTTFSSPNGGQSSFSQSWSTNTQGRVISATDGRGVTTSTAYDARGRVQSVSTYGSPTLSYNYYGETQRSWSSSDGTSGSESLDTLGRVTSRSLPGGINQSLTYDQLGRVQTLGEVSPSGYSRSTTVYRDPLGRPTSQIGYASPLTQSFAYQASGAQSQTITTFSNGLSATVWTDGLGRTVKSQDALSTTYTSYNALGQPLSIQQSADAGNQSRQFTYTGMGDLQSRTEPETGTTTFSGFDAFGNPTTISDGVRSRSLAFDGLGRLRSVNGGAESLAWVYDGMLLKSASTVSNGQTVTQSYAYNGPGARLSSETLTGPMTQTIGYDYDYYGRLSTLTYPSGRKVGYQYDGQGHVNAVTQTPPGTSSPQPVTSLIYFDGWGQRSQLTFASGARSQWTSTATGAALQAWTVTPLGANAEINGFSQDANGNLSSGGGWNSLTHDAAGRLTAASGFGENVTLTHDGFGNNTSSTMNPLPTGVNNFGFSAMTNNQTPSLTSSPTQASSGWNYQSNGEATQVGTGTGAGASIGLQWDGLGRLSGATLNGQMFTNTYAPSGMRVKVSDSLGYGTRGYAYTSGGLLLGEYDGNGGWKRDVVYLGGEALAEIDANGTHELHNDHLGSPRVITSRATGQVEGRQVFGPYGEKLPNVTSGYQPLTGYTGHTQQDPDGLIYMRGRFYSPAWHRFLNSDQGADSSTFNQMAYVGGSPLTATDPSGMQKYSVRCGGRTFIVDAESEEKAKEEVQKQCGGGGSATVNVTGDSSWINPFWTGITTPGPWNYAMPLELRPNGGTPPQEPNPCGSTLRKINAWAKFLAPHGIGITGQAEAGAGIAYPGHFQGSASGMVYYNDNGSGNKFQYGTLLSGGGGLTLGGYAGVGAAVTLTNARSNNDERGLSVYSSINAGWGPAKVSITFSISASGIWNLTIGPPVTGVAAGGSFDLGAQKTAGTKSNAPTTSTPCN